ncbi:MAG TPA: hypothetical protein EYP24_01105 [bacterium (Candidatus Stahlbacteria)]|nr:hypothetical protein [Candidatus Stahlbacteria bacterium]
MTSAINNYTGRGTTTSWFSWNSQNQSWTGSDILNNGDRTPIVFNIASQCGDCLSEIWLEKYPGGAVASVAPSDITYTIPNQLLGPWHSIQATNLGHWMDHQLCQLVYGDVWWTIGPDQF